MSSIKVREFSNFIETLFPLNLAYEWDNCGLIIGDYNARINKIFMAVDPSYRTIDQAISFGADLLFTHHPLIFDSLKQINTNDSTSRKILFLLKNKVNCYCSHTNADVGKDGVNDFFIKQLGVKKSVPIEKNIVDNQLGLGRIGSLEKPISLEELCYLIKKNLPKNHNGLQVVGDQKQPVKKIAFCGGSGDKLLKSVSELGADVYITADLRHAPVYNAREFAQNMAIINLGHSVSEFSWLKPLAIKIKNNFPNLSIQVQENVPEQWDWVI